MSTAIAISYIPGMYGTPGQQVDIDQLLADLPKYQALSRIYSTLWALDDDGTPMAIISIKQAKLIATHLLHWCEKDLTWFTAYLRSSKQDSYILAIHPDIARSIQRFNLAQLVFNEVILPASTKYKVLYAPLIFHSGPNSTTWAGLQGTIKNTIRLATIEEGLVKPGMTTVPGEYHLIGDIKYEPNPPAEIIAHLDEYSNEVTSTEQCWRRN